MKSSIPSGAEVKARLKRLGRSGRQRLSKISGVPFSTIRNIADHEGDPNPGVDTVRRFWRHLDKAAAAV